MLIKEKEREGLQIQYFFFDENLQNNLEDVLKLVENGSRSRSSKKLKECIESRNKLIRIADISSRGWDTVKVYESDSIASDSADEREIRAAERSALSNKKRGTLSATTTAERSKLLRGELY